MICGERFRGDDGAAIRAAEKLDAATRLIVEIVEVVLNEWTIER